MYHVIEGLVRELIANMNKHLFLNVGLSLNDERSFLTEGIDCRDKAAYNLTAPIEILDCLNWIITISSQLKSCWLQA